MSHISALGIELWTMSDNIVIDNIYVGDDIDDAEDFAAQTFTIKHNQESAYESAMSPNEGVLRHLLDATEERPWLWAVYVLAVLLPIVVIAVVCFGRRGRSSAAADYKKTDEPQPDDEVPDLVGDEEEPTEGVSEEKADKEESGNEARDRSKSPARKQKSTAKTKNDLEEDNGSASQEGSAASSAAEEDVAATSTSSPKGKRVRQRRQD
ncbi:Calnexin [Toxocara canis]|nr:Calnexin [Toxocara canis]